MKQKQNTFNVNKIITVVAIVVLLLVFLNLDNITGQASVKQASSSRAVIEVLTPTVQPIDYLAVRVDFTGSIDSTARIESLNSYSRDSFTLTCGTGTQQSICKKSPATGAFRISKGQLEPGQYYIVINDQFSREAGRATFTVSEGG
jgi:hypothetical protein